MSIRYTQTSNKCINRILTDKISAVATAYCDIGALHIGYTVRHNDLRESSYIPDNSTLPTLVICSRGNEIVDIKGNNPKIKNDAITALKQKFVLNI